MTKMLEKAFSEAAKLPEIEQNAVARWLLEEIDSEKKWEQHFAESEAELENLALEALEQEKKGETTPLDPDQL